MPDLAGGLGRLSSALPARSFRALEPSPEAPGTIRVTPDHMRKGGGQRQPDSGDYSNYILWPFPEQPNHGRWARVAGTSRCGLRNGFRAQAASESKVTFRFVIDGRQARPFPTKTNRTGTQPTHTLSLRQCGPAPRLRALLRAHRPPVCQVP